jgi:hypothetical protein
VLEFTGYQQKQKHASLPSFTSVLPVAEAPVAFRRLQSALRCASEELAIATKRNDIFKSSNWKHRGA